MKNDPSAGRIASTYDYSRRDTLALLALFGIGLPAGAARAQDDPAQEETVEGEGEPSGEPFSYDILSDMMRTRAEAAYEAPAPVDLRPAADSYDAYRMISFRSDHARWSEEPSNAFQVHAFHMGWLFQEPVRLFEVSDGMSTEVIFTTDDFEYRGPLEDEVGPEHALPGIAGFRLNTRLNRPDRFDELVSFLGASYFRALGRDNAYGLSARGVAIDTATERAEEFPRFSEFWLSRDEVPGAVVVYAALDSQSLTGAYRMVLSPGATTVMDVTARLFARRDIGQLGIAPLTSMFLYSEKNRSEFDDYRPAVHDSDGLLIERRDGDHIWRPLNNPPNLSGAFLAEENPVSFGLYQRDRDFENYQDSEANYERRPSLKVEPLADWGRGTVRLIEIPTRLEANDNIVAFWTPEEPLEAGDEAEFAYRLHWGDLSPEPNGELAYVFETRAGAGGFSGVESSENARKFVVDFAGGMLSRLPPQAAFPSAPEDDPDGEPIPPVITLVASAGGGEITTATLHKVEETGQWRAAFDVEAEDGAIVELNAHIAGYGRKLTEIWLYQWINA
ncbi:glucan biosynthesis protein [Pelagovum pacificum]|uniref:Glucan biosynthesis protein n=1 Tax=Pelagovum pacificum TaxID=2588711 RepID=A0A5C5GEA8_9RHOB|nr:glucan biosynthesis protein G [Pelagovum pacificum]QQA43822.1 glucan biosynthesis protein [Pelagovum pacificum]TNY33048.1 glucan biosynthesis protein [Pelagovum pacificum]